MVRFDTGKCCLWAIIVNPKSLVLSCCDANNKNGSTKNVLLGDGYGQFGWIYF